MRTLRLRFVAKGTQRQEQSAEDKECAEEECDAGQLDRRILADKVGEQAGENRWCDDARDAAQAGERTLNAALFVSGGMARDETLHGGARHATERAEHDE